MENTMADNTWQVGVYLVHDTNKLTKEIYTLLDDSAKAYEEKQKTLLEKLLVVESNPKYESQKLHDQVKNKFDQYLFYRKHPKAIPEWKDFFELFVRDGEKIKAQLTNMNESFVLFLYHRDNKKLYAICGGYGSFTIQNHVQDDFGINILIRIVNHKGEKILKHAKEFGVTGGIIGVAKYFRQNYNFYENKNFGNIYREISASIDQDTAKELGLVTDKTKQCIVKNSFKINQAVTYEGMINIVDKLDSILKKDANFSINDIKKLDIKKDEALINSLEKKVLNELWSNRTNTRVLEEHLDFIHKDFEKFILAKSFKVAKLTYEDKDTLFTEVISRTSIHSENEDIFIKNIKRTQICSLDENNEELTEGSIFNHLVYELSHKEKSYFLINGDYYQITANFKNSLNESCKDFIKNNYDSGLTKQWGLCKEGEYNLLYKGEYNTIVLDTVTPENIEACDILKYDESSVYFYHVKEGFNGSMRDLTNQVFIAASRIQEDLKSGTYTYLKSIYKKMQNMDQYKNQISPEENFLSIFRNKKLYFVLAVKDAGDTNRKLVNIESFSSNIAKFSLNELIQKMNNLGVNFKIAQINVPSEIK